MDSLHKFLISYCLYVDHPAMFCAWYCCDAIALLSSNCTLYYAVHITPLICILHTTLHREVFDACGCSRERLCELQETLDGLVN